MAVQRCITLESLLVRDRGLHEKAPKVYGRRLPISQAKGQSIQVHVLLFGGLMKISSILIDRKFPEIKKMIALQRSGKMADSQSRRWRRILQSRILCSESSVKAVQK